MHHQRRHPNLPQPLPPPRPTVNSGKHAPHMTGTLRLSRGLRPIKDQPGPNPRIRLIKPTRASHPPSNAGHVLNDTVPIAPVRLRTPKHLRHHLRRMVGQIRIHRPRSNRPSRDQRQRRNPRRMIQRKQLSDKPTNTKPNHMHTPQPQRPQQLHRVSHQIPQVIPRRIRINKGRPTSIPQVVTHHITPNQRHTKLIRPTQHTDPDKQHRRIPRIPKGLNAKRNLINVDPHPKLLPHHQPIHDAKTPPVGCQDTKAPNPQTTTSNTSRNYEQHIADR